MQVDATAKVLSGLDSVIVAGASNEAIGEELKGVQSHLGNAAATLTHVRRLCEAIAHVEQQRDETYRQDIAVDGVEALSVVLKARMRTLRAKLAQIAKPIEVDTSSENEGSLPSFRSIDGDESRSQSEMADESKELPPLPTMVGPDEDGDLLPPMWIPEADLSCNTMATDKPKRLPISPHSISHRPPSPVKSSSESDTPLVGGEPMSLPEHLDDRAHTPWMAALMEKINGSDASRARRARPTSFKKPRRDSWTDTTSEQPDDSDDTFTIGSAEMNSTNDSEDDTFTVESDGKNSTHENNNESITIAVDRPTRSRANGKTTNKPGDELPNQLSDPITTRDFADSILTQFGEIDVNGPGIMIELETLAFRLGRLVEMSDNLLQENLHIEDPVLCEIIEKTEKAVTQLAATLHDYEPVTLYLVQAITHVQEPMRWASNHVLGELSRRCFLIPCKIRKLLKALLPDSFVASDLQTDEAVRLAWLGVSFLVSGEPSSPQISGFMANLKESLKPYYVKPRPRYSKDSVLPVSLVVQLLVLTMVVRRVVAVGDANHIEELQASIEQLATEFLHGAKYLRLLVMSMRKRTRPAFLRSIPCFNFQFEIDKIRRTVPWLTYAWFGRNSGDDNSADKNINTTKKRLSDGKSTRSDDSKKPKKIYF